MKQEEMEAKKKALAAEAEGKEKEMEKKEADGQEEPEGEEDHEDVEKDKSLILDMIKKHMGEACEGMEGEAEGAAMEAYEAYCEMGMKKEEAVKSAADAMKLAKHMSKKKHESEKEEEDESEEKEMEAEKKEGEEKKMESALIKAQAKIALLEREVKKSKLTELLDKKLKESGFGRAETSKIRELIGEPKSESHITHTIKVFTEAYAVAGGESLKSIFSVSAPEKTQTVKTKAKVDFNGCLS